MNLSAIKKCCNETKHAVILTDGNGDQWITNGVAMYRTKVGMDSDMLVELFDLTEKQMGQWIIGDRRTEGWRASAYPDDRDVPMREVGRVMLADETLLVLDGDRGVVLVNQKYLKPVKADYRRYFLRIDDDGAPLVAVFEDLTCAMLVCPLNGRGNRDIQELAETIVGRPWVIPVESSVNAVKMATLAEAAAEALAAGIGAQTGKGDDM